MAWTGTCDVGVTLVSLGLEIWNAGGSVSSSTVYAVFVVYVVSPLIVVTTELC